MDDLVLQAMARWPNVPAVFGWLRLDRRGRWLLVDRGRVGFDESLHGAGSPITSPPIVDFIGRNYAADERGRWYWQNGPQRVFVDLEVAPLVLRVLGEAPGQRLVTHTGFLVERIERVLADDAGDLWLVTDRGTGIVDDRDLASLALELDDPADPAAGTTSGTTGSAPPGTTIGHLDLMGQRPVQAAGPDCAALLRFVRRPRD